jgi:hypothetical protein
MRRNEFALGSVALAIALSAIGTFRGDEDHSARSWLIVSAIIVAVAAVVFWVIVPRIDRVGRGALIFAILGALSIVVFWLGIPPVLAGAAAMLALVARGRGTETGMATIALALAALTVAAAVVVAIIG